MNELGRINAAQKEQFGGGVLIGRIRNLVWANKHIMKMAVAMADVFRRKQCSDGTEFGAALPVSHKLRADIYQRKVVTH